MRYIELLSPARNLECGIEAVRHGADAVYIGAPHFGARAAAGNSVEDIASLVRYAHSFGARIYVTVNTLLHDDEFPAVQTLIDELAAAEVDALITQDPRLLPPASPLLPPASSLFPPASPLLSPSSSRVSVQGGFPALISPLPLHSSTQMDNRTIADVRARLEAGYEQTVLARELSIDDIRAIHEAVPGMPLEAFVHGALCVCYSGRCYASEHLFGRSANRGECAQVCRLPFDLVDANGQIVNDLQGRPIRQCHLLSLRDMNRSADLEAMLDAGITSFKIEGRLKDVTYVKNITAYYSQLIDSIIRRRPNDFCRASHGRCNISFTPDPARSFNRGFTDYFLHTPYGSSPAQRPSQLANFATPKSIGQPVAVVRQQQANRLQVATIPPATLTNGDGLCYFDAYQRLHGFRMNRIDEHNWIFPAEKQPPIQKGTTLYRNLDVAWERILSRPTAERKLPIAWHITDSTTAAEEGFTLTLFVLEANREGKSVSPPSANAVHLAKSFSHPHEAARTPQADNIRRQLSRLGDTIYEAADVTLDFSNNWFIPASTLAEWRRQLISALASHPYSPSVSVQGGFPALKSPIPPPSAQPATNPPSALVSAPSAPPSPSSSLLPPPLMTCRYCLRHELGACLRKPTGKRLPPHLSLRLADGRTFPLHFDCNNCEMQLLSPDAKIHTQPNIANQHLQ